MADARLWLSVCVASSVALSLLLGPVEGPMWVLILAMILILGEGTR